MTAPYSLEFDRGTVLVRGDVPAGGDLVLPGAKFDDRVGAWRAPARYYRAIHETLTRAERAFEDHAASYARLDLALVLDREPFPHQAEAVEAWWRARGRGVVVLPTGAGKTFVAQLVLRRVQRSALFVTPTIDLMQQWYGVLSTSFDTKVGLVGGGYYEIEPLTVTTYDSAWMHMERLGASFGLIVFDECHHLPGPSYQLAAEGCLAPFRLGLTATPERGDGRDQLTDALIGPVIYRREIGELAGEYLSDYEIATIRVRLSEAEREEYATCRERYLCFLREYGVSMGSPGGWSHFLALSARSAAGREAFLAYRRQKEIAQASAAKIRFLDRLLERHRRDRTLIFTSDNHTVYSISRRYLIPAITHQTKVKERHEILEGFHAGTYPAVVTSRVLNEGVDVPSANVAVVLSGSGSVREHVQRLGRILRRGEDKRAILYEVVAEDTAEEYTSQRRRQHDAYGAVAEDGTC